MTDNPYFYMFLHVAGFALWSSFWPRQAIKKRLEPKIGYRAYRLLYVIGTVFLFGASLLYLFQRSALTTQLWNIRVYPWGKPLLYVIGTIGIFFFAATAKMGLAFWGLADPKDDALNTTGYYKITRHPLYWSVFCLLLGHTLVLGSGLAIFYFVGMEAYNWLGVYYLESPNLIREYGERYRQYQEQVSTIPFLSLIRGKVKFEKGEFPVSGLVFTAIFTTFVVFIHDRILVWLCYYLPPLGHVTEKVISEWHRVFGGG